MHCPGTRLSRTALLIAAAACCDNEATYTLPSPNGSRVAVLYHRDCAGFVGYGYHLSIMKTGAGTPRGLGNAATFLVPDSLTSSTGRTLALRWLDDNRLLVAYDSANTRADVNAESVRGVRIVLQKGIPDSLPRIRER